MTLSYMKLDEAIVVVNEYTIKNNGKGIKGGSRGGTPGNYVLRYMARDDAVEIATPVTLNHEDCNYRYMERRNAVDTIDSESEVKRLMYRNQRHGGIAFGRDNLSMSNTELVMASRQMQDAFKDGKTVFKTVISFKEEYLKEKGIVPENFEFKRKGDYKGNIDQMKLRNAISGGIDYMSRGYEDLDYVGIIQVDTAHVHCHLAMVDMGNGKLLEDGTQKGKINSRSIDKIRRGIDITLDDMKNIQYMSSNVQIDNRNVQTNLKKYTYKQLLMYGAPQRIMSELPEDDDMWHAGTKHKDMEKADKICRDYVENILKKPDSGFDFAMQSLSNYVTERKRRERLEEDEEEELLKKGRNDMIESCMESVYSVLKNVPEEKRVKAAPFMDMVSSPVTPSFRNDTRDMVYRMTTFQKRYDKHKSETEKYSELAADYEKAESEGNTDPASVALYQYFLTEREYQEKLASKYSHFLFRSLPSDEWSEKNAELLHKSELLSGMKKLLNDTEIRGMKPVEAEKYARDNYDVYGGRYLVTSPEKYMEQVERYEKKYNAEHDEFCSILHASGLKLDKDDKGNNIIKRDNKYDFSEVRGLDLHELNGDFNSPLKYSDSVKNSYIEMAQRRIGTYDNACQYLNTTGQGEMKEVFDNADIDSMRNTLEKLYKNEPIRPAIHPVAAAQNKKVIRIDKNMHNHIKDVIETNMAEFSAEYDNEAEHVRY